MKQSVLQRYENVKLLSATPFYTKSQLDMEYLLSLKVEYLLQNHLHEAGILGEEDTDIPYMWGLWDKTDYHKGWEDPTSQLRGHFLGHWLSAAAYMYKLKEEPRLKGKIEYIIGKLAECQERNGNGWAAGIPEKYLQWVAEGKTVWAPHYNIHKTFMGLIDVARIMDNKQAYEIAANFAEWFYKWSGQFSEEKMQDILECETGGMMEAFADLYSLSKDPKHLELMKRYERSRLFDRMMADEDILTNTHANTTIPEIHGLCRAFEVTGDKRYYDRMEKYWMLAVEKRGVLATGGQTLGEIWMPENMGARYGYKNQEHCTVYNMIRLADYLYRATGDVKYQDYIEVNLYNGTMAQCFYKGYNSDYGHHLSYGAGYKKTVVTYFLPLGPGAKKPWASEKNDFFCCHGSAVQACATFQNYIFYKRDKGIIINQYIDAIWEENEKTVILKRDHLEEEIHRPKFWRFHITADGGCYPITLRVPYWAKGMKCSIDGRKVENRAENGYVTLIEEWHGQKITFDISFAIEAVRLKGSELYAFREGPILLAGLTDKEVTIHSGQIRPDELLVPFAEREWGFWRNSFITKGQKENIVFKYLYEICEEQYTVYFPVI